MSFHLVSFCSRGFNSELLLIFQSRHDFKSDVSTKKVGTSHIVCLLLLLLDTKW